MENTALKYYVDSSQNAELVIIFKILSFYYFLYIRGKSVVDEIKYKGDKSQNLENSVVLKSELLELSILPAVQPLMVRVKAHIEQNVKPITEEFFALDKTKDNRWTWHPRQLELLDEAKEKAKQSSLWNFFLPDSDTGEGLTNLAESEGFEPSIGDKPYTPLAGERLQPLGQLSESLIVHCRPTSYPAQMLYGESLWRPPLSFHE